MSYQNGIAAMRLEMPDVVPRTEYSVYGHYDLISAVTGMKVDRNSPDELKKKVQSAFFSAWDYGFLWSTHITSSEFGRYKTKLGHAEYADGGTDFDTDIRCPFSSEEEVFAFDPSQAIGAVNIQKQKGIFEQVYRERCAANPGLVNMTGVYVTMMSGLIELFGWDLLLASAGSDPERFGETANRYGRWISGYFEALAESDVPVIMVHDDMVWTEGAFIHPDWYRKFIFPWYKKFFSMLREAGKIVAFTSDGNFTEFVDDIAAAGASGFVMEPLTDMKYIAEKYGKTHFFVGNADTRLLLSGSKEDIYNEVKRCMDIGKSCPGFFMAVGNHIPANTPVENALYYNDVYMKLRKR